MRCPDCGGELELQDDGDVVAGHWQYDHTDAACLDCDAQFRLDGDMLLRADGLIPLDTMFAVRH